MPRRALSNSPPRLLGYVRVSSEEQAREGVSLDVQKERVKAYSVAHGVELVGIEEDAGVSGKISPEKRPGLARALGMLRRGDVNGLLVLKLDRLSRSTRDVLDLVDETSRAGWRLVSVSEHLDTATAAGRLVLTVLAALSQMEREQVGERTRLALDAVAREGRVRSRFTPFGWRNADGGIAAIRGDRRPLVPDHEEQRILARILRLRRHGRGVKATASEFNRERTTNPRTGGAWSHGNVAAILRTVDRRRAAGVQLQRSVTL